MSLLKVKTSAVVPRTLIIAAGVVNAANSLGLKQDVLITSGNDGTHMKGSKHYLDWALDFRTKTLTQKRALADTVKTRLGKEYDVILESIGKAQEHLHVEWDPQ